MRREVLFDPRTRKRLDRLRQPIATLWHAVHFETQRGNAVQNLPYSGAADTEPCRETGTGVELAVSEHVNQSLAQRDARPGAPPAQRRSNHNRWARGSVCRSMRETLLRCV